MPVISRIRILTLATAALAIVAVTVAAPSWSQANRGAQLIKYRQSTYSVLGTQFGIMGAMASGKAPYDAKVFQLAAERAAYMSTIAADTFAAGSDTGAPTKARPEIWSQQAEFQKLIKDLQDRTAALATAARSGNLDTVKPAFGAAGQACKACHDKYKLD
jgi:cytochrome c556